ncbi:hypothetical protein DPMN_032858 [Dreissena polymorpha]|uniref:Uncharacterized protein n=1 Tax=Dreissena polymorpha TaxID=45954 RepID=A0A9D4M4X5_DREPO|nr:hypothetical protein DPMN_032858 [Dreissena polymorpha]
MVKYRNSSDGNSDYSDSVKSKQQKHRGPSEEAEENALSNVLGKVNAVLYADSYDLGDCESANTSVFVESGDARRSVTAMADSSKEPTNRDIMACMKLITDKFAIMHKCLGP